MSCITGYEVEYTTNADREDSWVQWPHSDLSLKTKISSLNPNTNYWVRVRVIFKGVPGQWSDIVPVTTTNTFGPPDEPQALTLTPGNQRIDVSWQAPTDDGGSPVVGYEIVRTDNNGDFIRGSRCDPTDLSTCITGTSTSFTGLVNGITYEVAVSACNLAGCGFFVAAKSATPRE